MAEQVQEPHGTANAEVGALWKSFGWGGSSVSQKGSTQWPPQPPFFVQAGTCAASAMASLRLVVSETRILPLKIRVAEYTYP
jgi:hypothetical protein